MSELDLSYIAVCAAAGIPAGIVFIQYARTISRLSIERISRLESTLELEVQLAEINPETMKTDYYQSVREALDLLRLSGYRKVFHDNWKIRQAGQICNRVGIKY